MKPKGKGWNRGEGSVGAVVGCLWGKWLRWRNGGARWWLTWEKKMGEWFVWLAAEKGECRGSERGCWMEKRKASAGSRKQKSKAGRAALFFFLFKGRQRPEEEDETSLGFFFVFGSSFLKNYSLLNIFSPGVYGWRFTYIENLYMCYLEKYYNNYYRDCLL